jgi:hypothetical protein
MVNMINWIKERLGLEVPPTAHPQSIIERLEGLIPPVADIEKSYKIDRRIAKALRKAMLAIEELMKETLQQQQQAMEVQGLQMEQQEATAGIIEAQVHKAADAQTIIQNFRIFLTEDEKTIEWILQNIIEPSVFASGFGRLDAKRQRELFNSLQKTVNDLQRTDSGMLAEPGKLAPDSV